MNKSRAAIMEKARIKRLRRSRRTKGQQAPGIPGRVKEIVQTLVQGAAEPLGHLVSGTAESIKQVVRGTSAPSPLSETR